MKEIETEKEVKVVEPREKITYKPSTKRYGNAAYTVIARREGDHIKQVYLVPEQQPDEDRVFKIDIPDHIELKEYELSSWTHKGVDRPTHWQTVYCDTHEAWEEYWYVPQKANSWKPKFNFGERLTIQFENKRERH